MTINIEDLLVVGYINSILIVTVDMVVLKKSITDIGVLVIDNNTVYLTVDKSITKLNTIMKFKLYKRYCKLFRKKMSFLEFLGSLVNNSSEPMLA